MEDSSNFFDFLNLFSFKGMSILFFGTITVLLLVKYTNSLTKSLSNKFPARRLLILQISTMIIFILYIFGFSSSIYIGLNPSKEMLLALGGSAAVAIGFSLKDIVSSLVAGLILLFDRPFQVGDMVTFGDVYGEIKSIGLRTVRIQTLDDNLVTVPNSRFINDHVASGNAGELDMMIVSKFHVAIDENVEKVRNLLYEIVTTSRYVYLKKPVVINVSEVEIANRLALCLTVKAYVIDIHYEKTFQTDITIRATQFFEENEIRRPKFLS